jgi:hypothetical protein
MDLDKVKLWEAGNIGSGPAYRCFARAADCGEAFAAHIQKTMNPLPSLVVFDMFAVWGWLVWKIIGSKIVIPVSIFGVVSGFPMSYEPLFPLDLFEDSAVKSGLYNRG